MYQDVGNDGSLECDEKIWRSVAKERGPRTNSANVFWFLAMDANGLALNQNDKSSLHSRPLCISTSQCTGFTSSSEDSSELWFLLVENYNYDRSCWSSDRLGIFEYYKP